MIAEQVQFPNLKEGHGEREGEREVCEVKRERHIGQVHQQPLVS